MITPTQKLGYEIRNAKQNIRTGLGYVDLPDSIKEKARQLMFDMDGLAAMVLDHAKEQLEE